MFFGVLRTGGTLLSALNDALFIPSLRLQHEPLGAAIVDDLCRVEIALRVRRHVMDDVEVAVLDILFIFGKSRRCLHDVVFRTRVIDD